MATPADHERLALYAVDALGRRDRRAVEGHLAQCPGCRARLVELGESGMALDQERAALESGAVDPPQALLARILEQAASRTDEPDRLRALGLAVLVAVCSVMLLIPSDSVGNARKIGLQGAAGVLTVDAHGRAVLIVKGLKRAPRGLEYKVWLLHKGHGSLAAVFVGGKATSIVPLTPRLRSSAVVAVSLEATSDSIGRRGRLLFAAPAP